MELYDRLKGLVNEAQTDFNKVNDPAQYDAVTEAKVMKTVALAKALLDTIKLDLAYRKLAAV